MSQRKKQISAFILIFIFTLYYVNISFFYHSHTINGIIISHSHFHTTAHTQTGTHTAGEISLISALSHFQSLQAALLVMGIGLFLHLITVFRRKSEKIIISSLSGNSYLRGPPLFYS